MGSDVLQIRCCISNLIRHQYGSELNELQAQGVDIQMEKCQSRCAGCRNQPAFVVNEQWVGLNSKEEFKRSVLQCGASEDQS